MPSWKKCKWQVYSKHHCTLRSNSSTVKTHGEKVGSWKLLLAWSCLTYARVIKVQVWYFVIYFILPNILLVSSQTAKITYTPKTKEKGYSSVNFVKIGQKLPKPPLKRGQKMGKLPIWPFRSSSVTKRVVWCEFRPNRSKIAKTPPKSISGFWNWGPLFTNLSEEVSWRQKFDLICL